MGERNLWELEAAARARGYRSICGCDEAGAELLARQYPAALQDRYKVSCGPGDTGYALLEQAGRRRGFLVRGGEVDTGRMARILLDEFRSGKLGRFTLELPEEECDG